MIGFADGARRLQPSGDKAVNEPVKLAFAHTRDILDALALTVRTATFDSNSFYRT